MKTKLSSERHALFPLSVTANYKQLLWSGFNADYKTVVLGKGRNKSFKNSNAFLLILALISSCILIKKLVILLSQCLESDNMHAFERVYQLFISQALV